LYAWPKVIILIDADAFFASVEIRDNPQYKGLPVIVGARLGTRGVVSTCSYEARKYGVRSAMPISTAYKLCPDGVYLIPDGRRYREASKEVFHICRRYTPYIEVVSIDEAYLDVTPSDGRDIAEAIRRDVQAEVGVTVTAGVSYCKYLAKIVAGESKPDGVGLVSPDEALEFLAPLSVGKLPGVGPKSRKLLEDRGIRTVADLRGTPQGWLQETFGKTGSRLWELARGIDPSPVVYEGQAPKSLSEETTFETDVGDRDLLFTVLARLSADVGFRLRKEGMKSKTVGIKVRYSDFKTVNREVTMPSAFDSDARIYSLAKDLFSRLPIPRPIRLLGVGVYNLVEGGPEQPMLFGDEDALWDDVSKVADNLRRKYGRKMIEMGASLKNPKSPPDA